MDSLFDRSIEFVSPSWALKRARSRAALTIVRRGFEAGDKGHRTENWRTTKSLNEDIKRSLKTIVARSRYLSINNAYARRGISAIPSHVVRRGIMPNASGGSKRFERALRKWANSKRCDFDSRHNLYGLQWLAMKTIVESGEVLIRKRIADPGRGVIPLKLQILEPDHLDTNKPGTKQGIEFNDKGERVAYWLYEINPNETGRKTDSVRILAEDIIHAFETIRPGQLRGIPALTSVIIRLKDFDEYEDAQLLRQKIAACLVGVIHDIDADEPPGKINKPEWDSIKPGSWEILPPGKTVSFNNPPAVQGYSEYASSQLHAIAAGLLVPYEILTGDFSQVNFSSARMAFLEFYKNVEHWQQHIMIGQVCEPIAEWFEEIADLTGISSGNATITWGVPNREYVDPGKEIKAQILSIRAGLSTLYQEIRKSGEDPEELLEEYATILKSLDSKGMTLDSDPRNKGTNENEPKVSKKGD